jgi:thymidine kinase
MFSGKTTELLRRIRHASPPRHLVLTHPDRRHGFAGRRSLVIKHAIDTRYTQDTHVATHDTAHHPSHEVQNYDVVIANNLMPLLCDTTIDQYAAVGIDEGQFVRTDRTSPCPRR